MNQFFEALANMPPEQLSTIILAIISGVVTIISAFGGGVYFVVRWIVRRNDAKFEQQKEERNTSLNEQAEKSALEMETVRREMDLKFKEQDAETQRLDRLFSLFEKTVDKQTEANAAFVASTKAHAIESEKFANAIKNVGEILEVQVTRFQVLDENISKVEARLSDLDTVRQEIISHRLKVDKVLDGLEASLKGKAQKEEVSALKTELDNNYQLVATRLDDIGKKIEALQVIKEEIVTEKEKE